MEDDALISAEKRFRESNGRPQLTDGTKNIPKNKKLIDENALRNGYHIQISWYKMQEKGPF